MLDPRIYRAAFLPVLFVLVLAAFSLKDRPRPVAVPALGADAFAGQRAFAELRELARVYPDRRPGGPGDAALASRVARALTAADFRVRSVRRRGQTIDGERELETVIAERTGNSDERIVVVAHRDAAGRGALAELSGTAGLLELARVFGAPRRAQRTIVLVSTSGGSGGSAGARALAETLSGPVGGVVVLGDLASRRLRRPLVVPWSNALGASAMRLRRTAEEAVRAEAGASIGSPGALMQFMRLALPATLGEQGVLLEGGLPAVLLSATGERPPGPSAVVTQARLQSFGRAALRTMTALDAGPSLVGQTASRDLLARRKLLPGWAVRALVGVLLLPVLLAAIDAFARVRRRGEAVGAWLRWTLIGASPFVITALLAMFMGIVGLLPVTPDGPVSTAALPVEAAALAVLVLGFVLSWLVARPALLDLAGVRAEDPAAPGAGAMVMLVLCAAAVAVWIANPYAAALLVAPLHVWLFAIAPGFRMSRAARIALVGAALVPLAIAVSAVSAALGLSPAGVVWTAALLVASGQLSPLTLLVWSILAGCAVGAFLVAGRGHLLGARPPDDRTITVRGPHSYAGPGSLGGTDSALRR